MTKTEKDCSSCQGLKYCISKPNKKDYKFPEEENQYLIDLECGIWNCHTAVIKLLKENAKLENRLNESNELCNKQAMRIAELQKENKELKKDLQTAISANQQWLKRDTRLEEQIEKMKYCLNCHHLIWDNDRKEYICKYWNKNTYLDNASCSEWVMTKE